jgi:general secretion pathway protein A
MYTEFYGLREKPFSLSPDPRFLFLSDSHREALAHLLYGIEQGEGFIAITGEVGTGKTTLCRTLLQRLEPGSEVAFLFNPQLSGMELLQAIDAEFGLATEGKSRRELMDQLNRFLLTKRQEGRRVLLLIDEAQNLDREALEQVRLLSNLETDTTQLIQIILLGQPELDALLESAELRQLRQRINVRWPSGATRRQRRASTCGTGCIALRRSREALQRRAARAAPAPGRHPALVNLLCDARAARRLRGGASSARRSSRRRRRDPRHDSGATAPGLGAARLAGQPVAALIALAGSIVWQRRFRRRERSPVERRPLRPPT